MKDQAAPSCTDSCPAGYYCGKQSVNPVPCKAGTYCPEESAAETPCSAGTYNGLPEGTSEDNCLVCLIGHYCEEGSKAEKKCPKGTYGNEPRLGACISCEAGKFQGALGQTACGPCLPGTYCEEGAAAPSDCDAGTYSSGTNLSSANDCKSCPAGFYCGTGATKPVPCPEGTVGIEGNRISEAFCIMCPGETTSLSGTTDCDFCNVDFYASAEINQTVTDRDRAVAKVECSPCLDPEYGATCSDTTTRGNDTLTHGSTSLASVRIEPNYWRLSAKSMSLSVCLELADGNSSCVGGSDAGNEDEFKPGYTGSGYCKVGHTGPLCQVCNTSDYYFDRETAMECIECPAVFKRLALPLGIIGGLLALVVLLVLVIKRLYGERLHELVATMKRVVARIRQLNLVPRCKLLITFYQVASQITTVYNVQLTGSSNDLYKDSVAPFSWATVNWDGYLFPGQCVPLGFQFRLLLRALTPLLLLIAIPLCVVAFFYFRRARGTGGRWLINALMVAAPFALFVSFVMCPTVSKGIFDTWDCTKYELDGATGAVRTFLNEDLRVVCGGNDYPEEYEEIKRLASFFLLIWPVGMPVLYLLVLFPIRKALWQERNTRAVQATAFLHKEYKPTYFWWDVLALIHRLVLTGWVVFFINIENDVWRLFLGVLTTIGYLSLIQFVQPYKRKDINTLAIATQFSLVCVFLGGTFIKLLSSDGIKSGACDDTEAPSCANESRVLTIVAIMVVFNFSVLTLYVLLIAYQFSTSFALPSVRLVATGKVPELKLEAEMRYHLFLSYVWSSGQGQMSTVKRELQLLLNGIRVFLDVDEQEEIGQLETYVRQSQSVLLFLSKGYFFSENCRKEIAATLASGNPIMLLRETDPNRGGSPIP